MSEKHELNFPETEFHFWQLIWIGMIVYHNKQFKVEFFFINKKTPEEHLNEFAPKRIEKKLIPVGNLSDYKISDIYGSVEKNLIKIPLDIITTTIHNVMFFSRKKFPIPKFSNLKEINFEDFNYLVLYGKLESEGYNIIISPYLFLKYFLGNSDKLMKYALRNKLADYFFLKDLEFFFDTEQNQDIVKLKYNSDMLTQSEAELIAPLFFLKNNIGLKFINSIGSHINSTFLNNKKDIFPQSYLSVSWDFSGYEITLRGETFKNIGVEKKPNVFVKKNFFLAHEISSLMFITNSNNIDRITLIPHNPKNSTLDRENHDPEDVTRDSPPKIKSLLLQVTQDTSTSDSAINSNVKTSIISPFNIKVDFEKRNTQNNAYNVNYIPNNKNFEGLVRDLDSFDSESKNIRENIKIQIKKNVSLSNLIYFNGVVNALSNNYKLYIEKNMFFEGNENPILINGKYLKLVEVAIKNNFVYLIEFENGMIGSFYNIRKNKISREYLYTIVSNFIKKESIKKNKLLWTYIESISHEYEKNYEIGILKGVKHIREIEIQASEENVKKDSKEVFFNETARKIYDRINKIP